MFRNSASGNTDSDRARVDAKSDDGEIAESGWSIADDRHQRDGTETWTSHSWSLKLAVTAEAAPDTGDDPPDDGDDDEPGGGDDGQDDEPVETPALPLAGAAVLAALLAAAGARARRT